jgi:hypothetical protein
MLAETGGAAFPRRGTAAVPAEPPDGARKGDPELLRRVERAMGREEETVAKRRTTTAGRRAVGA